MGEKAVSVPLSIRITAQQKDLLQKIAKKFTEDSRKKVPFVSEVTPAQALRMIIEMTAAKIL